MCNCICEFEFNNFNETEKKKNIDLFHFSYQCIIELLKNFDYLFIVTAYGTANVNMRQVNNNI